MYLFWIYRPAGLPVPTLTPRTPLLSTGRRGGSLGGSSGGGRLGGRRRPGPGRRRRRARVPGGRAGPAGGDDLPAALGDPRPARRRAGGAPQRRHRPMQTG